jgi:hypothetical protein
MSERQQDYIEDLQAEIEACGGYFRAYPEHQT